MSKQRTYTNNRAVAMELCEIAQLMKSSPGIYVSYTGPLHTYPVAPGKSITLSAIPGVRRVWRNA